MEVFDGMVVCVFVVLGKQERRWFDNRLIVCVCVCVFVVLLVSFSCVVSFSLCSCGLYHLFLSFYSTGRPSGAYYRWPNQNFEIIEINFFYCF